MEKISNFECGETKDGFIIVKSGRNFKQVDVELVIGYVRSIAYMYDICLNWCVIDGKSDMIGQMPPVFKVHLWDQ